MPTRLVNGLTNFGRVEVFSNAHWISVCDQNFDRSDALVVCRQLGFTNVSRHFCCSYYGMGPTNATTYLTDLSCTGQERSLDQCSYNITTASTCSPTTIASVECIGKCIVIAIKSTCWQDQLVIYNLFITYLSWILLSTFKFILFIDITNFRLTCSRSMRFPSMLA